MICSRKIRELCYILAVVAIVLGPVKLLAVNQQIAIGLNGAYDEHTLPGRLCILYRVIANTLDVLTRTDASVYITNWFRLEQLGGISITKPDYLQK